MITILGSSVVTGSFDNFRDFPIESGEIQLYVSTSAENFIDNVGTNMSYTGSEDLSKYDGYWNSEDRGNPVELKGKIISGSIQYVKISTSNFDYYRTLSAMYCTEIILNINSERYVLKSIEVTPYVGYIIHKVEKYTVPVLETSTYLYYVPGEDSENIYSRCVNKVKDIDTVDCILFPERDSFDTSDFNPILNNVIEIRKGTLSKILNEAGEVVDNADVQDYMHTSAAYRLGRYDGTQNSELISKNISEFPTNREVSRKLKAFYSASLRKSTEIVETGIESPLRTVAKFEGKVFRDRILNLDFTTKQKVPVGDIYTSSDMVFTPAVQALSDKQVDEEFENDILKLPSVDSGSVGDLVPGDSLDNLSGSKVTGSLSSSYEDSVLGLSSNLDSSKELEELGYTKGYRLVGTGTKRLVQNLDTSGVPEVGDIIYSTYLNARERLTNVTIYLPGGGMLKVNNKGYVTGKFEPVTI